MVNPAEGKAELEQINLQQNAGHMQTIKVLHPLSPGNERHLFLPRKQNEPVFLIVSIFIIISKN